MLADPRRVKDLFGAALELTDPLARAAFLDSECAGDAALRRRLDVLLAAHDQPDAALEQPLAVPNGAATTDHATEVVGTLIAGRYKLLEEIGHGGMGNVWMAEQRDPVKRLVAVKLIKPGMDSRAVLARFEAERQALALMDHPNIAKVLDGGSTSAGRPFFVMELVKGLPLTVYCDDRRLSVRARLELFVQVCAAVQHAHQKGLIHRDLKPTNILVTEHDGKPMPKVIDFGLAKALHGSSALTDKTLHTAYGTMVGTPLYMAPEQVGINALDVDTRTDIYALGVILYELLTGTTPLEKEHFQAAAWEEMKRLIREEEPPRPSTRLSSSQALPGLAARRQTEPAQLSRLVRGELDWIVLKALEKDRNRRYETATGLALDVQRHLADEPVLAFPPSASYRLQKFLRKHRGSAAAAVILLAALTAGIAGTTAGLVQADAERKRAVAAEREATEQARQATAERDRATQAAEAEGKAKKREAAAREKAMDALRAMTDDVVVQLIGAKPTLGPSERAFLNKALTRWQAFAAETGSSELARAIRAEGAQRVAYLRHMLGQTEQALAGYREANDLLTQLNAEFPAVARYRDLLATSYHNLGIVLQDEGKRAEAEGSARKALVIQEKLAADFPSVSQYRLDLANYHNSFGILFLSQNKRSEAEVAYRRALAIQEKLVADFPAVALNRQDLASSLNNLGNLLRDTGKHSEAEAAFRRALVIHEKLAQDFPADPQHRQHAAGTLNNLGNLLRGLRRRAEAETAFRQAVLIQEKLTADFPTIPEYRQEFAMSHSSLGVLLTERGKLQEAALRRAIAIEEKLATDFPAVPQYRANLANSLNHLGLLFKGQGKLLEAQAAFRQVLAIAEKLAVKFPADPKYLEEMAGMHINLAGLLTQEGKGPQAEAAHRQALPILEKLVADFPAIPEYRQRLGVYHCNLGNLLTWMGKRHEAEVALRQALAIQEQLVAAFPAIPDYLVDLGGSEGNLANLLNAEQKPQEALAWYAKTITTLHAGLVSGDSATGRRFLRNAFWGRARTLAELGRYTEALPDWDQAVELSPPIERRVIRMGQAVSRVRAGQVREALAEVDELARASDAITQYNAACVYALAAARRENPASTPTSAACADRAMELLRQAVANGYKDAMHLKKDEDLSALRTRSDFQKLVVEVERPRSK